jgi:hypothetical protein
MAAKLPSHDVTRKPPTDDNDLYNPLVVNQGPSRHNLDLTTQDHDGQDPGVTSQDLVRQDPGVTSQDLVRQDPGVTSQDLVRQDPGVTSQDLVRQDPGVTSQDLVRQDPGVTSQDLGHQDPGVAVQDVTDQEEEALEYLYRVLSGSLDGDQLPPLHSKIVRIFTSSTFTGFHKSTNSS